MEQFMQFLAVMAALSASAQTMTNQLKKRFQRLQYTDNTALGAASPMDSRMNDFLRGKFAANMHLMCGINGFLLAALGNIEPLTYLGIEPLWSHLPQEWLVKVINYLTAGVMVAYGGPWFHEVLGIAREYKNTLRGGR